MLTPSGPVEFRRVRSLSALVCPPGDRLVVLLKAYFDDSGDPCNAGHSFLTIAGYIAEEQAWQLFEDEWKSVLDAAGAPYLHMREFNNPSSAVYQSLNSDLDKKAAFICDLAEAIGNWADLSIQTTVSLRDLEAFNHQNNLAIDPHALGIYGCLKRISEHFKTESVDIVLDKFDRAASRFELAVQYADSDVLHWIKSERFTPTFLQKHESWRDILPLQAADFLAWEIRKRYEDRKGFVYSPSQKAQGAKVILESYLKWAAEFEVTSGRAPRERRSYAVLRKLIGVRSTGLVMDTHNLEQVLKVHPNGWGC